MPKVNSIKGKRYGSKERHAPLGQVIQEDENRGKYASMKHTTSTSSSAKPFIKASQTVGKQSQDKHKDEEDFSMLDEKTSRRILALSHEQLTEFALEEHEDRIRSTRQQTNSSQNTTKKKLNRGINDDDDDDDEEDDEDQSSFDEEEDDDDDHE